MVNQEENIRERPSKVEKAVGTGLSVGLGGFLLYTTAHTTNIVMGIIQESAHQIYEQLGDMGYKVVECGAPLATAALGAAMTFVAAKGVYRHTPGILRDLGNIKRVLNRL